MRTRACILAAIVAASCPLSALAQQQPVAPDRARAREHFQAGVAAYTRGDYAVALREFQDAYRIAPHPSVRVNLANCFMQLHQPVDALNNFEAFLRESASVPPAQRREIERQMGELRTQVGEVRIAIGPAGARDPIVSVDGQTTTVTGGSLRMTPGHHVIEVSADGYQPQRTEIDVFASSQRDVQIALRETPPPTPVAPAPTTTAASANTGSSSNTTPAATNSGATATSNTAPPPSNTATSEPAPTPTVAASTPPEHNPPAPLTEPTEEHHGLSSGVFYAGVGVTALALVGTAVFGILAVSNNGTYEDAAGRIARGEGDFQTEHDRGTIAAANARQDALLTDVCLGVTIVAAGATAILYTQTDFGGEHHVTVSPVVGSGSGGLVVGGRF